MPNPYSPPSVPPERNATPWYETTPSDWEKTASIAWICACLLLLTAVPVRWQSQPQSSDRLDLLRPLLPGPQMVGVPIFLIEIPVLSLIPAAVFGAVHWGLMRFSRDWWYRLAIRWFCITAALVGCAFFAFAFHGT